jgi:biopolymer transport protein ExbD
MGMASGRKKGGAMASMNVVPLIDILLLLLIIFMVIDHKEKLHESQIDGRLTEPNTTLD